MAFFDILALIVIGACIFMSMTRGVIIEIASVISWLVSFVAAKMFAESFADIAFSSVEPRALAVAMAFAAVFVMAWAVQRFLRSLLTSVVSAMGLGSVNRLLGGVFGAVKGLVVMMLITMVGASTDLPQTDGWANSVSAPYFEQLAQTVVPHLQEAWQHRHSEEQDMQNTQDTDSENMQI